MNIFDIMDEELQTIGSEGKQPIPNSDKFLHRSKSEHVESEMKTKNETEQKTGILKLHSSTAMNGGLDKTTIAGKKSGKHRSSARRKIELMLKLKEAEERGDRERKRRLKKKIKKIDRASKEKLEKRQKNFLGNISVHYKIKHTEYDAQGEARKMTFARIITTKNSFYSKPDQPMVTTDVDQKVSSKATPPPERDSMSDSNDLATDVPLKSDAAESCENSCSSSSSADRKKRKVITLEEYYRRRRCPRF